MQFSRGRLDRPEIFYEPGPGSVDRTTFSAQYNRLLRSGNWATTFTWGRNEGRGGTTAGNVSDGFLIETNYNWALSFRPHRARG